MLLNYALACCKPAVLRWLIREKRWGDITENPQTPCGLVTMLERGPVSSALEILEMMLAKVGEAYVRERFLWWCKCCLSLVLPLPIWKALARIGVRPYLHNVVAAATESSFFTSFDTIKYFVEELHCPLPSRDQIEVSFLRQDVLVYLKQRKVF